MYVRWGVPERRIRRTDLPESVSALAGNPAGRRIVQVVHEHDQRQAVWSEAAKGPSCRGSHRGQRDAKSPGVGGRPVVDLTEAAGADPAARPVLQADLA